MSAKWEGRKAEISDKLTKCTVFITQIYPTNSTYIHK